MSVLVPRTQITPCTYVSGTIHSVTWSRAVRTVRGPLKGVTVPYLIKIHQLSKGSLHELLGRCCGMDWGPPHAASVIASSFVSRGTSHRYMSSSGHADCHRYSVLPKGGSHVVQAWVGNPDWRAGCFGLLAGKRY